MWVYMLYTSAIVIADYIYFVLGACLVLVIAVTVSKLLQVIQLSVAMSLRKVWRWPSSLSFFCCWFFLQCKGLRILVSCVRKQDSGLLCCQFFCFVFWTGCLLRYFGFVFFPWQVTVALFFMTFKEITDQQQALSYSLIIAVTVHVAMIVVVHLWGFVDISHAVYWNWRPCYPYASALIN